MKLIAKLTLTIILLLASSAVTGVALAQSPIDAQRGGIRGEVMAVSDSSLTISTPSSESITVNVTDETRIWLAETRHEGSLADIEVGNFIGVRGQKNDDGSIEARLILVLPLTPRNLDRLRGRVSAIEGEVIVLNTPDGLARVVTDENTRFRIGKQPGDLSDIKVDDPVLALGQKRDDGQLAARLVIVATAAQVRQHTLRGEVLTVDVAGGQLSVQGQGPKEAVWQVQTTENTKYRVPGVENAGLANINVGDHVLVVGRKTGDGENTGVAWGIAVIPDQFKDSRGVGGEVTGVGDTTFTLTGPRGQFTILTGADTRYRMPGRDGATFAAIEVGSKVRVIGQPVEDQDNTIQAQVVGIRPPGTS